MSRIYMATVHEIGHCGSVNDNRIANLVVRATSCADAEAKALKYASKKDWTARRISQVVEIQYEYEDIIP